MLRTVLLVATLLPSIARAEHAIVGTWQTPFQEMDDNVFYQLRRDFKSDGTFVQTLQVELHHPLFPTPFVTEIEEDNTYEIGAAVGSEGATSIEETLVRVFETTKTAEWVAQRNAEGYCGFHDWVLGLKREITGRQCRGIVHNAGDKHYNMFKIEGDSINFAIKPWHDQAIGSRLENRPPVLGPSIGYSRAQ